MPKKTIKINFCDWYTNFDKKHNPFTRVLRKHYKIVISEKPDFLFYSCYGDDYDNYTDCVKVYFTDENVIPNFNECDYAVSFDYINFGDRHFRRGPWLPHKICDRSIITDDMAKRKFCNFIYSNTNSGEGALLRQKFCQELMKYKHVDCPGRVLNNMSADDLEPRDGDWYSSKQRFLNQYKFTIAFENSRSDGYTTEKMLHPLLANSIPIYYGNPLVVRDFNPRAFINCNDYDNDFDRIIERIRELDNDDEKYLAMLRENPMSDEYDFDAPKKFEQWLLNIIERGNKPFNKDPRNWQQKPLQRKLRKLTMENRALNEFITKHHRNSADLIIKRGNIFNRTVKRNGYETKYVLGIPVKRRPINWAQIIDNNEK
ncbi:MAG: glycosyltransferase family 10 [Pseudomonadota bacterium]|nr:glycosyltransferase family 10 [Pseudomonadota bacterium]